MTAAKEESVTPPDSILNRFPTQKETIKELYEHSPTFREICADYSEMVTWLANHCQSEKRGSINCDRARELLKDLEVEINDCLERNNIVVKKEFLASTGK